MPSNPDTDLNYLFSRENENAVYGNNFHFVVQGYRKLFGVTQEIDSEVRERMQLPDEEYKKGLGAWVLRYVEMNNLETMHDVLYIFRCIRLLTLDRFVEFSQKNHTKLLRAGELAAQKNHTPAELKELNGLLHTIEQVLTEEFGVSKEGLAQLFR